MFDLVNNMTSFFYCAQGKVLLSYSESDISELKVYYRSIKAFKYELAKFIQNKYNSISRVIMG